MLSQRKTEYTVILKPIYFTWGPFTARWKPQAYFKFSWPILLSLRVHLENRWSRGRGWEPKFWEPLIWLQIYCQESILSKRLWSGKTQQKSCSCLRWIRHVNGDRNTTEQANVPIHTFAPLPVLQPDRNFLVITLPNSGYCAGNVAVCVGWYHCDLNIEGVVTRELNVRGGCVLAILVLMPRSSCSVGRECCCLQYKQKV